MTIYIDKIELSNYRSCKKTIFDPNESLSALIGVNGSGKSNILNGILLLKKITRISRHRPDDEFSLSGCKLRAWFKVDGKPVRYEALIQYTTNERNIDEVVSAAEKWNLKEITGQDKWIRIPLGITNFLPFPRQFSKLSRRERDLILARYGSLIGVDFRKTDQLENVLTIVDRVINFVLGISYYSASQFTDPLKCPTSFEIENDRLSRRSPRMSEEHLQFMYDLYSASKNNKAGFDEFISIAGREGIGLIDTMEYDEIDVPSSVYQVVTGGKVIKREVKKLLVIPNFIIRDAKLSPSQLSEGTFKLEFRLNPHLAVLRPLFRAQSTRYGG